MVAENSPGLFSIGEQIKEWLKNNEVTQEEIDKQAHLLFEERDKVYKHIDPGLIRTSPESLAVIDQTNALVLIAVANMTANSHP